jgi:hypothetical protein
MSVLSLVNSSSSITRTSPDPYMYDKDEELFHVNKESRILAGIY